MSDIVASLPQHIVEGVGTVGDYAIDTQVEHAVHVRCLVDRPGVDLGSGTMDGIDIFAVERQLLVRKWKLIGRNAATHRAADTGHGPHRRNGRWAGRDCDRSPGDPAEFGDPVIDEGPDEG